MCGSASSAAATQRRWNTSDWVRKSFTLWCKQRIVEPLAQAGRAADDHHRRFLGIGPGDRVAQAQPAHAIGHADGADAVDAGVGVGGEAGAVFAGAADQSQRAVLHQRVERQHVIAGDAEDVADAVILQPADQVVADRQPRNGRGAIRGRQPCQTTGGRVAGHADSLGKRHFPLYLCRTRA